MFKSATSNRQTQGQVYVLVQYNIQLHKNDCVILLYIAHEVKFTTYILVFKDQRRSFFDVLWLLVFKMITVHVYRDILPVVLKQKTLHIMHDQSSAMKI